MEVNYLEYLNKIRPLCKDLMLAILNEKPANVPLYCLIWLRQRIGDTNYKLTDAELEELSNIKQELNKYKNNEQS